MRSLILPDRFRLAAYQSTGRLRLDFLNVSASPNRLFINGPVFTSDPAMPWARGLAVSGSTISAVGGEGEISDLVGTSTRVVDLAGRMLMAGFSDSHVHPVHGGLARRRCDLSGFQDRESALREIQAYAERTSGWLRGRGWAFEWFESGCPSAELLDAISGGLPAYLVVRDGHSAWANTWALELAGITSSTPDPSDGRIERLPDGQPQGTLHEGAMELVERVMPQDSFEEICEGLEAGQSHLHSLGVTSWHDAWVDDVYHRAYLRLRDQGRLRSAVRAAQWWDRERGLGQIPELEQRRSESGGLYDAGTVKLMLDGVCENFTASLLEPYSKVGGSGIDFIDPDELSEIVIRLDEAGFQCHFHAIGDAAVRSALDAVEDARASNGWNDLRHTIAHIQVIHPDDIDRFRRLGVVANAQALWACNEPAMTELTLPFLGEERGRWQYPFGSLFASGAALAMGSDWPVSSADPLQQVAVAVRRTPPFDPNAEAFVAEQRLPLPVALSAFTVGSAHASHLEGRRGTLRVGNVADLVVLSGDPFGDADELRVDLTLVGGEVVHDGGEMSGG